jgi:hypothetical protein
MTYSLFQDYAADGKLGREGLTDKRFGAFQIEWTKNLSDALEGLKKGGKECAEAPRSNWEIGRPWMQ